MVERSRQQYLLHQCANSFRCELWSAQYPFQIFQRESFHMWLCCILISYFLATCIQQNLAHISVLISGWNFVLNLCYFQFFIFFKFMFECVFIKNYLIEDILEDFQSFKSITGEKIDSKNDICTTRIPNSPQKLVWKFTPKTPKIEYHNLFDWISSKKWEISYWLNYSILGKFSCFYKSKISLFSRSKNIIT